MRRLILGTAGHIDHGKTALVRALTGIDTDRLPEEKRRGITIDLGFASMTLPSGAEMGIVDVPGHEAFIRNMLAGATGVDLALLVVAADEGVMPQTREHLAILELLGVRDLVVALAKTDLVDADWLDLVRDEVVETIARGPFAAAPLLPVSAKTGTGLDELVQALDRAATGLARRDDADLFRMPIDRVFTIQGTGTVVTGTVWSGSLQRDQNARLMPGDREVRVRGLQAHGSDRDVIRAGERAAIALAGLSRDATRRGDSAVTGTGWTAASMLTVRLAVLAGGEPLRSRRRVRFHLGTAEVLGRVVVLDGTEIPPGGEAWAQLRLEAPVLARALDRFVLRAYSPIATIAGGTVIEPDAPKRRRMAPGDAAIFSAIHSARPDDALDAALAQAGWSGLDPASLAVKLGHSPATTESALTAAIADGRAASTGRRIFATDTIADARAAVLDAVDRIHHDQPLMPGADRDELRRALPVWAHGELADHVIGELVAEGALVPAGSALRRHDYVTRLVDDQRIAMAQIADAFATAGLAPPATGELPPALARRADLSGLLRLLVEEGRVVPLRPDLYVDAAALDRAIEELHSRLDGQSGLSPAAFRDLFGITRKHLIPLLEHLDRAGITTRHGDARTVNPP